MAMIVARNSHRLRLSKLDSSESAAVSSWTSRHHNFLKMQGYDMVAQPGLATPVIAGDLYVFISAQA